MTNNNARIKFKHLEDKFKRDKDAFLLVHFSKKEDSFIGRQGNMDIGDALILINELIRNFGIDKNVLIESLNL